LRLGSVEWIGDRTLVAGFCANTHPDVKLTRKLPSAYGNGTVGGGKAASQLGAVKKTPTTC